MRFGRLELKSTLGAGPAGPVYLAIDQTNAEWEVRTLVDFAASPGKWRALRFRLRLLAMIDHEVILRPGETDFDHDPAYLALPASQPAGTIAWFDQPQEFARGVVAVVAEAHRIGLILGAIGKDHLRRTSAGRLAIDLTGTGEAGTTEPPAESTTEDDILRLGELLKILLDIAGPAGDAGAARWPGWPDLVRMMLSPDPADRPLAIEVARWFDCEQQASSTPPVDVLAQVASTPPVGDVELVRPSSPSSSNLDATIDPSDRPAPAKSQKPRLPGTGDQIGRFLLLDRLGEGGMGVVHKAEDRADGSVVAIKLLKAEAAASPSSRRRFVKEARMLAKLDSPFVTRLIAADTDDAICYMAVEYVPGTNVGEHLEKAGVIPEKTALELIADAARGLAVAHRLGIIHRDIKPDNLLMLPEGHTGPRVKVTDFGLARLAVQSESLEVTKAGVLLGTPRYMSPEQFGGRTVDSRADVYALGATLFHLLTGQPPFPQTNLMQLTRAVISEPAPAADRVNPSVSAAAATLVSRCLAKEPSDRPADAGVFLREVERLLRGDAVDIVAHPRTPTASPREVGYAHQWNLDSSPAQLWPHVSNTERLNRAVGLPALRYEIRKDPVLGTRRFAHAKIIGFKMEWEEHPFEWIEGRRMGILREFARGPFVWMLSVVELTPRPGGGTLLTHTLRAEPRNWLGRLIAPSNLGKNSRKGLEAVYRRIDDSLKMKDAGEQVIDTFEKPTRLSAARQRRLETRLERLALAGSAAADATEMLGIYLANAPDQEVARIKPLAVARRFGVEDNVMTETCLRSVGEGLLQLQWDVICPLCRIPSGHRDTLRDVLEHESCPTCDAAFQTDFATAVELVFRVHPEVREIEAGTYCAGGPAHSPHVVAQVRLAPNERVELEMALSEGLYRVRGPQLPFNIDLRVAANAANARWEVDLESAPRETLAPVCAGGQTLVFQNGPTRELIIRVERSADRDDVLTAARVMALPAFRELFPGELLSPGQLAPASSITLLQAAPDHSEEMFKALGEARAFQLIQATLRVIETRVRAEGGVVVKTVGEGLLAAFNEVSHAVQAALSLQAAMAENPLVADMPLRVAVHRGMAMVATINNQLDYFGQTPRLTGKLLDLAGRNELAISATTASDHDVNSLFDGRTIRLGEIPRAGLGPILTYLVPLVK